MAKKEKSSRKDDKDQQMSSLTRQRIAQRRFDNLLGIDSVSLYATDPRYGKVPHTGNQFYRHSGS